MFGTTRVYPYERDLSFRTDDETVLHSSQAYELKQKVFGVKGPTILSKMAYNFISSTGIDIMHAVFEGVTHRNKALVSEGLF